MTDLPKGWGAAKCPPYCQVETVEGCVRIDMGVVKIDMTPEGAEGIGRALLSMAKQARKESKCPLT